MTIDAIGCQKAIAKKVVDGGGDYVLVVKGNQERLLADIQETVGRALDGELAAGRDAAVHDDGDAGMADARSAPV